MNNIKDSGLPLPLPYNVDTKGNEKFTENDVNKDSELNYNINNHNNDNNNKDKDLKIKRIKLSAIGNPLPLNYINKGNTNNEILNNEVVDVNLIDAKNNNSKSNEKPYHLRLSDLGDPLPLNYNSFNSKIDKENDEDIIIEPEREKEKEKEHEIECKQESLEKPHNIEINRRILHKYDFGSPLPLQYDDNETIKTDEYLAWKKLNMGKSFRDWKKYSNDIASLKYDKSESGKSESDKSENDKSESDKSECDKSENHQTENDLSGNELDVNRNAINNIHSIKDETITKANNNNNDIDKLPNRIEMQQEIEQFINNNDYKSISEKIEDPEFRLNLIRFTRQLKRQCAMIDRILNGDIEKDIENNENDDNNSITVIDDKANNSLSNNKLSIEWRKYLQSTIVSVLVFVLLCTISYFLAD